MAKKMPHAGHEKHMCYLVNVRTSTAELKKIVRNPMFICKNCARAAKESKHLCNPGKL